MSEKHVKLSRYLSYLLRHNPGDLGLTLDENGYVEVNKLLKNMNESGKVITKQMLNEIVQTDEKNRYSYNENETLIRANQGHSVKETLNLDLKETTPPEVLYHGTSEEVSEEIMRTGVNKAKRQFVHLSNKVDEAKKVGQRRGNSVVFVVDAEEMSKDGYVFYQSQNGVWLTDFVPPVYLLMMYK